MAFGGVLDLSFDRVEVLDGGVAVLVSRSKVSA
jgi:hypothetical protein